MAKFFRLLLSLFLRDHSAKIAPSFLKVIIIRWSRDYFGNVNVPISTANLTSTGISEVYCEVLRTESILVDDEANNCVRVEKIVELVKPFTLICSLFLQGWRNDKSDGLIVSHAV